MRAFFLRIHHGLDVLRPARERKDSLKRDHAKNRNPKKRALWSFRLGEFLTISLKDWAFPIVGQIVILLTFLGIVCFIQQTSLQDVDSLIPVVLTATSVLFGFLTLNMTMHLEELRKQKSEISNLAAELMVLLEKVRHDQRLAKKIIHYSPKYWKWGIEGTSGADTAESAILQAYDYLLKNVRSVVDGSRSLVLGWAIPGLGLLLLSISVGVLSRIVPLDPDSVLMIGLTSLVFGVAITMLGWWDSDRRLERNCDSLFNIRHTLLGDLYREDSLVGYMRD